jgi:1-aminocyclopropane-1-carboxylate deaminase/D-cysteine desulfhydrase-like pyridoxal-dependent ACC family enzyme
MIAHETLPPGGATSADRGRPDDFPRVRPASEPTPRERLSSIVADAGGLRLHVMRDGLQPPPFGANNVALAQGADRGLIADAVQSNFCRLCAAFPARLGMECHIRPEERVAGDDPLFRSSGNVPVFVHTGATPAIVACGNVLGQGAG